MRSFVVGEQFALVADEEVFAIVVTEFFDKVECSVDGVAFDICIDTLDEWAFSSVFGSENSHVAFVDADTDEAAVRSIDWLRE